MNKKQDDKLLMVFIKNPVHGKVKTRLASGIGEEAAFKIYNRLLDHTLQITQSFQGDKAIFYSDFIPVDDAWKQSNFIQQLQDGNDLGEKMMNAFQTAFNAGYKKVVIIGSDCYELTTGMLEQSFEKLDVSEIVIGPAKDGGYYLLGMKQSHTGLFKQKIWSTGHVYEQTLNDVVNAHLTYSVLPALTDIDEEKDLPDEWNITQNVLLE
jgi:rSAM/selenodomain-associated transferase 1